MLAIVFSGIDFNPSKFNIVTILVILLSIYLLALISSVTIFITSLRNKQSAKALIQENMLLKLIHVPAYILLFLSGTVFTLTIFTIGISALIIIFDGMTIFSTGLIGLAATIRANQEKILPDKTPFPLGMLQFIFCLDVVAAIVLFIQFKRNMKSHKEIQDDLSQIDASDIS